MKRVKDCFEMCNENIRRFLGTPIRNPRNVPIAQCALPERDAFEESKTKNEEKKLDEYDFERIVFDLSEAF